MKMKTAAIILNYNDAKGTVDAIRRINGFSCFDDIVVVDNSSTDDSTRVIAAAVTALNAACDDLAAEEAAKKACVEAEYGTDTAASDRTISCDILNEAFDDDTAYSCKGTARIDTVCSNTERAGHERIHFIRSDRNGGYGYGNNLGVRYAAYTLGAELAVIANPDAVFDEKLIMDMQQVFASDSRAAVVGAVAVNAASAEGAAFSASSVATYTVNKDEDQYPESNLNSCSEISCVQEPKTVQNRKGSKYDQNHRSDTFPWSQAFSYSELKAAGWKRRSLMQNVINGCPFLRRISKSWINFPLSYYHSKDICEVYAVHGSLLMVSTAEFLAVGGYDEQVFLYCEENILAEKLYRRGLKSFLLQEAYLHIGSVSITGSGLKAVQRQRIRNASECYYYTHYLGCSKVQLFAVRIIQSLVLLETYAAASMHLI